MFSDDTLPKIAQQAEKIGTNAVLDATEVDVFVDAENTSTLPLPILQLTWFRFSASG